MAAAAKITQRPLGNHELQIWNCHKKNPGAMNILSGLTLVTRQQIDEGLLKCALQEFQHMFPHLTSRLKVQSPVQGGSQEELVFLVPMECPILPLDTTCHQDMLHETFDEEHGPLWKVQLINESSMETAHLSFGPELAAIIEDDSDVSTRWRYFLRYMQGKVNQRTIEPFDATEEGFRNFILFTFHPCITDTVGVFHMLRQFLVILDSILSQDGNTAPPPDVGVAEPSLPPSIETLVQVHYTLKDWVPLNSIKEYIYPRKSPLEFLGQQSEEGSKCQTEVLRGWLNETETRELLAIMEEDDSSLQGELLDWREIQKL